MNTFPVWVKQIQFKNYKQSKKYNRYISMGSFGSHGPFSQFSWLFYKVKYTRHISSNLGFKICEYAKFTLSLMKLCDSIFT